jgi:hypothetical protein
MKSGLARVVLIPPQCCHFFLLDGLYLALLHRESKRRSQVPFRKALSAPDALNGFFSFLFLDWTGSLHRHHLVSRHKVIGNTCRLSEMWMVMAHYVQNRWRVLCWNHRALRLFPTFQEDVVGIYPIIRQADILELNQFSYLQCKARHQLCHPIISSACV